MNNLKYQFGQKLKRLRLEKGMTQEMLAEMIGVSVEFISLLERGINGPSFDTLQKLSIALERPVKDFFDFQ